MRRLRATLLVILAPAMTLVTAPAQAAGTLSASRSVPWPSVAQLGDPDININGLAVLGRRLYVMNNYSGGGRIHVLDPATGELLDSHSPITAYIPGSSITTDGTHLYVEEGWPVEGRIHKVDPATGADIAVITPTGITITGGIGGITFMDGTLYLVIATTDCAGVSIVALDADTGQSAGCFNVDHLGIQPRELTSAGTSLLYGSASGDFRVHPRTYVLHTLTTSGALLDETIVEATDATYLWGLACGAEELYASDRMRNVVNVYPYPSCAEPQPPASGGSASAVVSGGETVTSDPNNTGATPAVPLQTAIAVPDDVSGTVSITPLSGGTAPTGFSLLGNAVELSGPPATAASPYQVTFTVDASALEGVALADVEVFRNGVAAGNCIDPVAAVPDPCVVSRDLAPDGDALVTVRTSHFSTWSLGRVDYDLKGPFQPVDPAPTVNTAKAGAAIPVKFTLGGDKGLDVLADGYPVTRSASCTNAATGEIEQLPSTSTTQLSYDPISTQYTYTWKTAKTMTGCRDLVLRFRDGSELRAVFNLR